MAIPLTTSVLLSMATESILFGILTILFFASLHILLYKRKKGQSLNKPILAVSVLMYAIGFIHIVTAIHRVKIAFIDWADHPKTYLALLNRPSSILKETAYVVSTIVGDSFVVYRLIIVWGRKNSLLIPALLLLLGDATCGIGALVQVSRSGKEGTPIFNPNQKPWNISFFTLSLFTNISCTLLISFKIWYTERQAASVFRPGRRMSPVVAIVIESGAIYSVSLAALFGDYLSGSPSQYFIVDALPQLIGIAFTLIIVRIGLGSTVEQTSYNPSGISTGTGTNTHSVGSYGGNKLAMKPLAVHLSRQKFSEPEMDDRAIDDEGSASHVMVGGKMMNEEFESRASFSV